MLSFGGLGARVFVAAGATDLRQSFDTLAGRVREAMGRDPLSGDLFVFSNRRRDRIKVLFWDRSGYWLCAKRLEEGTFAWPKAEASSVELSPEELTLLLSGIDLSRTQRRGWYGSEKKQKKEGRREEKKHGVT